MLRTEYAFEQKGGFGMVRKLLRSVREYKTSSLLAPLFVTCEVILEVIIPMLMANLIDFGIEAGNMQYILKMGLALIICCIVWEICGSGFCGFCKKPAGRYVRQSTGIFFLQH